MIHTCYPTIRNGGGEETRIEIRIEADVSFSDAQKTGPGSSHSRWDETVV